METTDSTEELKIYFEVLDGHKASSPSLSQNLDYSLSK